MNHQTLGSGNPDAPGFPEQLQDTVRNLRAALLEVLLSVNADPLRSQDLARRFGVSKNLTWKISKVVTGADPFAAVPHIPGAAAMRSLFQALGEAGAPEQLLEEARRTAADYDRVVKLHTGDRNTLEIMIGDMLPAPAQGEHVEQSRKLAYQGNSGTWGVRAKVQLSMNILAPSADDPDLADLAQIGGLAGFRRLRSDARWLLFRRERWSDDDPHPRRDVLESLDPDFPTDRGMPLLGAFCSKPIPEIEVIVGEDEEQYELPAGPVGNTAAFTCIYGQVARRVGSAYARHADEFSEIGCNLITPAENLILDLLVHRDFDWAMRPELLMHSRLDGGAMSMGGRRDRNVLTVSEPVYDLGWDTAALATPLLPRHPKLLQYAFERLGWDPSAFRAFRFALTYPPIPTAVLLRSELPVR